MLIFRRVMLLVAVAGASFAVAYGVSTRQAAARVALARRKPPPVLSEGERLRRAGVVPGKQLTAYVFVSSRCSYCQRADTRAAIRTLRDSLQRNNADRFVSVEIVGVAINRDFTEGLAYLEQVGLSRFDEINVGRGWMNGHLSNLQWRDAGVAGATATVPHIVLVSREVHATMASALHVQLGADSVLAHVSGYRAIVDWVSQGARAGMPPHVAADKVPTPPAVPVSSTAGS